MDYSRIKDVIRNRNLSIEEVSKAIGITTGGFHSMVKLNTMSIKNLELIADFLDVPITDFFGESKLNQEISKDNKPKEQILVERKDSEFIKQLKEIISSKKEIIAAQKETLLVKSDLLEIKNNIISKYKSENDKLRIIAGKTGDVVVVDKS